MIQENTSFNSPETVTGYRLSKVGSTGTEYKLASYPEGYTEHIYLLIELLKNAFILSTHQIKEFS